MVAIERILEKVGRAVADKVNPLTIARELKHKKALGAIAIAGWVLNELIVDPLTSYLLATVLGHTCYFPLLIPFVHTELITIPILGVVAHHVQVPWLRRSLKQFNS
jgi:hypothetical protein